MVSSNYQLSNYIRTILFINTGSFSFGSLRSYHRHFRQSIVQLRTKSLNRTLLALNPSAVFFSWYNGVLLLENIGHAKLSVAALSSPFFQSTVNALNWVFSKQNTHPLLHEALSVSHKKVLSSSSTNLTYWPTGVDPSNSLVIVADVQSNFKITHKLYYTNHITLGLSTPSLNPGLLSYPFLANSSDWEYQFFFLSVLGLSLLKGLVSRAL